MDVARISRDAYAEAFSRVTGRPLVALPQLAGMTDSEIFFQALALNQASADTARSGGDAAADAARAAGAAADPGGANLELLGRYSRELAAAFASRRELLTQRGRALPGALQAVAAVAALPGVVQSVLTGTIRPNAALKLAAFGFSRYLDAEIGGYGSEIYPMGAQLLAIRGRAAARYGAAFGGSRTVYVADSGRDVAAARLGGAASIAVATGRATAGELRAAGPDLVLADLTDTDAVTAAIDRLTSAALVAGES